MGQVVTAALVRGPVQQVVEHPPAPGSGGVVDVHDTVRVVPGEVHHDESQRVSSRPRPGHQGLGTGVVRPARHLSAAPRPDPNATRRRPQLAVPLGQGSVVRLVRPAPEEHRDEDLPTVGLAVVPERQARQGRDRDRRSLGALLRGEGRGGSRLVMVLQEADEAPLIGRVGIEMTSHQCDVALRQPVVQPLVVAVVEAQLLQVPLPVPVRLRDEPELRVHLPRRGDHLGPVRHGRWRSHPVAPRRRHHVVEHQHGHVAAHRVRVPGDPAERATREAPQAGGEGVHLHHVRPRSEVGVLAVGEHRAADLDERLGPAAEVLGGAAHERVGRTTQPR